ncbi:MAG TPA: alpha/beta hydrolase-fold protein [Gaiellaceae bacterium]|nr:alpha/beta hydrolase-fold protein [Gaiellaceae bacterium]
MLLTVSDPERRLRRVRLVQELWRPRLGPDFARARDNGAWELRLRLPRVDRIEYRLELTDAHGDVEVVCDPVNPLRARGPFGEKSVLELPGYHRPAWLDSDAPSGRTQTVGVPSRTLAADVPVTVWSPRGTQTRRPLPLLVAHDGPEYAEYSGLLRFLAAGCAAGTIPPLRAALVPPVERNRDYSASARYARALAREILPRLEPVAPTEGGAKGRAGMGTSLGALAMLHAHRRYSDAFGGLFLQSGSFFRQRYDRHERDFPRFRRISRFVGRVLTGEAEGEPIPVAMTCGSEEENLANNRAVAAALAAQGYDVRLDLVRDAHNWVAWRDAFEPHLSAFLRRLWA